MKTITTGVKAIAIAVATASAWSYADTSAMEEIIVTAQKKRPISTRRCCHYGRDFGGIS